ncbi:MAG: DUF721 domain-containing protein [Candidatus Adiutrix sp.]|nr:DUF721 domain-containing protein [Candidatus Adiutrix sp.]
MSSSRRRKGELKPLSETLGQSLGRGYLNFTAQKLRVFDVWPQVVGETDAARTKPEMLHDGKLAVLVPGPAWLERFSYKKRDWLTRLNAELADGAVVEEIILKVGEF